MTSRLIMEKQGQSTTKPVFSPLRFCNMDLRPADSRTDRTAEDAFAEGNSSAAVWQYCSRPVLSTGLIREGELDGHPILRARHSRDVAFASGVFDKVDVPRPNGDLFSSRNFDLSPAAQRDHVLSAWGAMPIVNTATCRPMELGACDRHHLRDLRRTAGGELQFDFFGMRLIVRTCVEPSHEYGLVCLSHNHARLGAPRAD